MSPTFSEYQVEGFFDELFDENNRPRASAQVLVQRMSELSEGELMRRKHAIDQSLLRMGITFAVYGDDSGTEKIFPFDVVPRIIDADEWQHIEAGLRQRVQALNLFISDVYNEQDILNEGIVPRELLADAQAFREPCRGLKPPRGIWCHVTGTDLVRGGDGQMYVLEDNLRCPSGVSYVLQNRLVMKRSFPSIFDQARVRPVVDYSSQLYDTLAYLAPDHVGDPTIVVLTPGIYNSAYYEHSFLAQQMGVQLVEGSDLVVRDTFLYMKTVEGLSGST